MPANEKIKEIIKQNGKTQKELADFWGISKRTLDTKFYRGDFSTDDLIKIADFLDLSLAFVDNCQNIIFTLKDDE